MDCYRVDLNMESAGYGEYSFCFDNSFSIQSEKRVFFEYFLLDSSGQFLGSFDERFNAGPAFDSLDVHLDIFRVSITESWVI